MEWFLELLRNDYNFSQAAERLGLSYKWWAMTRKKEPEWEAEALAIREGGSQSWEYPNLGDMDFFEFCHVYAGWDLADHQKKIAEALEDPLGKVVLVLGHPESGKSTLISLWYVLYTLARNPDARIAIVTKNTTKAQDLLTRIKRYLTEEHLYDDTPGNLVRDFNGWKPTRDQEMEWSQNQIFVKWRRSGERDPSVQALGIGKQIYGSRLDLLILDDALVQDNQLTEVTRERIDNWFDSEARSRAQRGQTVVNGTRLLPMDLYGQWKKAWKGQKLFRHVSIPAILHEHTQEEAVNWKEYWTLDGYDLTETINGEEHIVGHQMGMRDIRDLITRKDPNRWKLVYQQEDVEEDQAIFRQYHIQAALELGAHRKLGQVFEHERLILAVDPATTGRAAALVLAVDPITQIRMVVDIFVGQALGATGIRQQLLYQFWEKYNKMGHRIDVTVIEENFVKTLQGDETLQARATAAGTQLIWPHTTGRGTRGNKWHEEYGIAAMAPLFGSGFLGFANAAPEDRRKLEPLIDDLIVFPWSDVQDCAIVLWLAVQESKNVALVDIDQGAVKARRGVPPVVMRR